MSPRCLIINADVFGFTLGITEGIVEAFQEGILTSTGLHLNITSGRPVLPPASVPTLVTTTPKDRKAISELIEQKAAKIIPARGKWRILFLGFSRSGWTSGA